MGAHSCLSIEPDWLQANPDHPFYRDKVNQMFTAKRKMNELGWNLLVWPIR